MTEEGSLVSDKVYIANQIKNITLQQVDKEMNELIKIGKDAVNISPRSRIGNNVVDFFTFVQRLETKGKYDVSFFEFLQNIEEFKKKTFIQTMIKYYKDVKNKNNTKNEYIVLKEVYNICISAINIMRPLNCMEIYTKYNAKRVLNFCAGWGGSAVAAAALNLDAFYGVEINVDLQEPYTNMITYLKTKCATFFSTKFCDALEADYDGIVYDTVFSSPPYYFIEKYANNAKYASKKEMDAKFYTPLFTKTYNGLQVGGHYIINICKEVYENVLKKLFGEAHEMFPLKKSKRQNNYTEMVYVWHKATFSKVAPNPV
jgi:16S rRNA G966 N2-methylase RsmD